MRILLLIAAIQLMLLSSLKCYGDDEVKVGSKVFTESVILGEMATQLGRGAGLKCDHVSQLGGTRVLWDALINGQIDTYPEYTGTIVQELLPGTKTENLKDELAKHGLGMTAPLGFDDTYDLGMTESRASTLGITRIGDLSNHPELRIGLSNEFLERKDGWPAVKSAYGLSELKATGLDHDLAYRALAEGTTDVTDLYTTDAEISFYQLRVLKDNKHVFPSYEAVFLYRLDLGARFPAFVPALSKLQGAITPEQMIEMNAECKLQKKPEWQVARGFLARHHLVAGEADESGPTSMFVQRTKEHLFLVVISLLGSIAVAVPLGILSFEYPKVGQVILGTVSVIYTIPTMALLVFMIPLLGIGTWPAITALFLYALLPIVRNTHAGLSGISRSLRDSAAVLGLSHGAQLWRVEMPLAAPSVVAGIKTAAVINVGTATLGALIGAGGYGQFILTGVRLADNRLILLGAVPAAILALMIQGLFGVLERWAWPRRTNRENV